MSTWILAVDAGNTVTRLAAVADDGIVALARWPTGGPGFESGLGYLFDRLVACQGGMPKAIGVACVVPERAPAIAEAGAWTDAPVVSIGPQLTADLPIAYRPPEDLGPDRLANAVAARQRFGAPCIVVDLGTALSLEVVDEAGVLRGGALFPGLEAAGRALSQTTAQVSFSRSAPVASALGESTDAAIAAGLGFGFPGAIDALLERIRSELGYQAPAVLTGGGARRLPVLPRGIQAWDPHLTLRGIALVADSVVGYESSR